MSEKKRLAPESAYEQARLVREMCSQIRGFLSGEYTRRDIFDWTRRVWPDGSGQGSTFLRHGTAECIFTSLYNIEEQGPGGEYYARTSDLEAYLRWLLEGDEGGWSEELVFLPGDLEEFAAERGVTAERYIVNGLGWFSGVLFASAATGQGFRADQCLTPKNNGFTIYKLMRHGWRDAIIDLFEELGIDGADVLWSNELVNLNSLPCWQLVCEDNERLCIGEFQSYAKAVGERDRVMASSGRRVRIERLDAR